MIYQKNVMKTIVKNVRFKGGLGSNGLRKFRYRDLE